MKNNTFYIFDLREINKTQISEAGGKGASLGELTRIDGIKVPGGFCISTKAYSEIIMRDPDIHDLLDSLAHLKADERTAIRSLSESIRNKIEGINLPDHLIKEIALYLEKTGNKHAYAVRSSATAEDLPSASFAGQQDTYLNIIGLENILKHIVKCWASLFTERAVTYRIQNGYDHSRVLLAVIIQKMVFAQAAGILFTADPVNGNRKIVSIDAGFGLGEALVSGLVTADNYKVQEGKIADKKISAKKFVVHSLKNGGTAEQELLSDQQNKQELTDTQILQLETIGRKIETHFGSPQDIEWCLADNIFYIVQSRPITTLFPIPQASDHDVHVYVSVGHQQMMTDAFKPLGLSFWLLTGASHMRTAGGRLFVDITTMLATTAGRKQLMNTLGRSEPLIHDALQTILEREDLAKPLKEDDDQPQANNKNLSSDASLENDPSIPETLIKRFEASLAQLKQDIGSRSGAELFEFISEDILRMKQLLFDPQSYRLIMAAAETPAWINEKMLEWLGEKNAADTLSQSLSHNITSEMGLALLDVADVIRPYPEIVEYLQNTKDDNFLNGLRQFNGGEETRDAIDDFLDKYGMRCAGEIDITRTRWSEKPLTLVPAILNNIKLFEPGEGRRKFDQGLREAQNKEKELLNKLKQLPDGEQKAVETKNRIDVIRNFAGYREYPKYAMVSRYFVYKQAMLKEAERLTQAGILHDKEDIYYLTFDELHETVRNDKADHELISKRKEEFKINEKLKPPRVITSDGEIISGNYKRNDLPAGSLAGLAVSSGIIEGRARIILKMEDAELEDGDILVTAFTDPSWTPLFVSIKGLITEVGGIMTHGAVIAREYGIPAVVCVENATKLIQDGQRIRVNGTEGFVEIL